VSSRIKSGAVTSGKIKDGAANFDKLGPDVQVILDTVDDNDARISTLEAAPKANIATTAPTIDDDINAGFIEGSVWVDTTSKEAYILVDSSPGSAVWKQVTNNSTYYSIGDIGPAGGIVFFVTDGGLHGMEAAPTDHASGGGWGCWGTLISGADETAFGTGAQNTIDIISSCSTTEIAADVADNFEVNGYDDWYLPSLTELKLMYLNIGHGAVPVNLGNFSTEIYWSSSEFNVNTAWTVLFDVNGPGPNANNKNTGYAVRAIRSF
jgi:hypothetical protein